MLAHVSHFLLLRCRNACYGSAEVSFPAVLPYLAQMPKDLLSSDPSVISQLLSSIWHGWEVAGTQGAARAAAAECYVECLIWTFAKSPNVSGLQNYKPLTYLCLSTNSYWQEGGPHTMMHHHGECTKGCGKRWSDICKSMHARGLVRLRVWTGLLLISGPEMELCRQEGRVFAPARTGITAPNVLTPFTVQFTGGDHLAYIDDVLDRAFDGQALRGALGQTRASTSAAETVLELTRGAGNRGMNVGLHGFPGPLDTDVGIEMCHCWRLVCMQVCCSYRKGALQHGGVQGRIMH